MAEGGLQRTFGCLARLEALRTGCAAAALCSGTLAMAQGPAAGASAAPPAPAASVLGRPVPQAIVAPRLMGRLGAADIGLVINTADPYSVAVGEYYIRRRGLTAAQVLRVQLPVVAMITPEQFEALRQRIDARFGKQVQALALAWVGPYAVHCNSISGALALGYDADLCNRSCQPTKPSRYFNAATFRPYTDLGFRLSMLLAAPSVDQAKAMIDRGVASDFTLNKRGRPPVTALLLQTSDGARAVRQLIYPPAGPVPGTGVDVRIEPAARLSSGRRLVVVQTGAVTLDLTPAPDWVPGALADHLTSYGGDLLGGTGQSNAMEWIASGATASHGTVTEPCNHLQKFPHPQVLLLHYMQGATAVEAYWRSVAWPQQALFVGEPLAAPFSPPLTTQQAPASAPAPGSTPAPPPDRPAPDGRPPADPAAQPPAPSTAPLAEPRLPESPSAAPSAPAPGRP
jgi:uncharacterized protein (TIGR03790 family)